MERSSEVILYNQSIIQQGEAKMVDTAQEDVKSTIQLLGNRLHVERTKAQVRLRRGLEDGGWASDTASMSLILAGTEQLLVSDVMEERLGGLMACPIFLSYNESLAEFVTGRCQQYLEDPEVRVRMAVGDTLGALAQQYGVKVSSACCRFVYNVRNLE